MTVFLAETRERSTKDGVLYESLIDYEKSMDKRIVISTIVAELYSFTKFIGSC